jgi:hypothetical protein
VDAAQADRELLPLTLRGLAKLLHLGPARGRRTIEFSQQVRPRYAGYLAFQAAAGDLVEQHLRGAVGFEALFDRLSSLHRSSTKPPQ